MFIHVQPPQRVAQRGIGRGNAHLPARPLGGYSRQHSLFEMEPFVIKRLREVLRTMIDHAPAQPGFPGFNRRFLQLAIEGLQELRLGHIHGYRPRHIQQLESALPVIVGRQRLKSGKIHFVNPVIRVAARDVRERRISQRRFELQHGLGSRRGRRWCVTEQLHQLLNVLHKLIADHLRARIISKVVVPIRQREAADCDSCNHLIGILGVGDIGDTRRGEGVLELQAYQQCRQIPARLNIRDAAQQRPYWLGASRFDGRGVHTTGIVISHAAAVAGGRAIGGRGVQDGLEALQIGLRQFVKLAPARAVCRDGMLVYPRSRRIPPEIVTGLARGVEHGTVDAVRSGLRHGEAE